MNKKRILGMWLLGAMLMFCATPALASNDIIAKGKVVEKIAVSSGITGELTNEQVSVMPRSVVGEWSEGGYWEHGTYWYNSIEWVCSHYWHPDYDHQAYVRFGSEYHFGQYVGPQMESEIDWPTYGRDSICGYVIDL